MTDPINWTLLEVVPGRAVAPPEVVTTQRLLDLCGIQDANAYRGAVLGLITMLVMLVWIGRIRARWLENAELAKFVPMVDKALMVFAAMQFVIIIVSLLRAG